MTRVLLLKIYELNFLIFCIPTSTAKYCKDCVSKLESQLRTIRDPRAVWSIGMEIKT